MDNAYPPPQVNTPQTKTLSGLGISGLVLGILAIVISWVPIINNLAAIIGVIGLILAAFAIYSTRPAGKKNGRGISIAGAIICALAIAITLGTQYLYGKALDEVSKSIDKTTSSQPQKGDKKNPNSNLIAGKYLIENVKVEKTGTDAEGKPTVVVSYDLTNKGDKKSNPLDLHTQVFQDKTELQPAIYMDPPKGYDAESMLKSVLPGGKKTVTEGFVLTSETSPVHLEIAPTISLDDNATKISKDFPIK